MAKEASRARGSREQSHVTAQAAKLGLLLKASRRGQCAAGSGNSGDGDGRLPVTVTAPGGERKIRSQTPSWEPHKCGFQS